MYALCHTSLAPKVILFSGHDKACDHWSWTVLVNETSDGTTPFYKSIVDQIDLVKDIVQVKLTFPNHDEEYETKVVRIFGLY